MSKKSRQEGARVSSLIKAAKGSDFYIADVDLDDDKDGVVLTLESIVKTLGKLKKAFMIISAKDKYLIVGVYIPDELGSKIDSSEWIKAATNGFSGNLISDNLVSGNLIVIETENAFKSKDIVRANGFAFLYKNKLLEDEESSEEECLNFDDI